MKDSSVEGWRNKEVRGGQKKKEAFCYCRVTFFQLMAGVCQAVYATGTDQMILD